MTVKNLFKFIFINLNNKMIGGVYLIQPTELIGTNRYKIGCSHKRSPEERIRSGYHSGTKKILLCPSNNPKEVEKEIIKQFNIKFNKIAGNEYYEGDINSMIKEFTTIYNQYNKFEDNNIDKKTLLSTCLTSSEIISCKITNQDNEINLEKLNYRSIFIYLAKTLTGRQVIILFTHTKPGKHTTEGFNYIEELQISFQGKNANGGIKDILTIIEKMNYNINICIKLNDNKIITYKN